ncbi:MAG: peptidase M23 [Flexibacter sp. CG_4_10_14_3_um_filter_32_15]|nr:MAG: peptidase M23 [Flexibacter sp. CG_4_10_14_3_um_filter_32_15]
MKTVSLISFILFYFSIVSSSFSQINQGLEGKLYQKAAQEFEKHYNNSDYDSIFEMYGVGMKGALPLDRSTEFFSGLFTQVGKITKREFSRYDNGTYAVYKTNFERAILGLNISVDNEGKINGLFIKPFEEKTDLPKPKRNKTKLILPFEGQWNVFWGGDNEEQNYHVVSQSQKNAFDLVIQKEGKSYKTDGQTNEDYYAFGKEIFAPCDGEVVLSVDGVKDNKIGQMNTMFVSGNTVIIKTPNDEYLFFAHFKQNSIKVKQGQKVKQGELLGLCGNSGNSSEPHLHFHIQNTENSEQATGIKCYFDKILVDGKEKEDYSPLKNEVIENMK